MDDEIVEHVTEDNSHRFTGKINSSEFNGIIITLYHSESSAIEQVAYVSNLTDGEYEITIRKKETP